MSRREAWVASAPGAWARGAHGIAGKGCVHCRSHLCLTNRWGSFVSDSSRKIMNMHNVSSSWMRYGLGYVVTLATACGLYANPVLVHSFSAETKVKGPLTALDGFLYGVAEKGGVANHGYIGRFDPVQGTWSVVHEFSTETKIRGGLVSVGRGLWFVCEKGGAGGQGYLGSYDPSTGVLSVLTDFWEETKPKTAPVRLDDRGWYFLTEKRGATGLGALMRWEPGVGLQVVASFDSGTGVKFEALPVRVEGSVWYAAREGGDLTQMAGKGAGAIGTVDLATGTVTRRLALQAALHGAKIRAWVPYEGRLYYAAEEGGDLGLNAGKGFGGVGWYDPTSNTARLIFVCDGSGNGAKPRALVVVQNTLYFLCGEGGPNGGGTIGRIQDDRVEIVAVLGAGTGAKAEALTWWGRGLYFTTELGAAHWFGGIGMYEVAAQLGGAAPALAWRRTAQGLELQVMGDLSGPWIVESATDLAGPWGQVTAWMPGSGSMVVPMNEPARFFRLRRVGP